jgi:hypothetical protein
MHVSTTTFAFVSPRLPAVVVFSFFSFKTALHHHVQSAHRVNVSTAEQAAALLPFAHIMADLRENCTYPLRRIRVNCSTLQTSQVTLTQGLMAVFRDTTGSQTTDIFSSSPP